MRNAFIDTVSELAQKNKNVYLMVGDIGFGVLDDFIKENPDNFVNAGIAEQNMTSVAAGLALTGKTVFTYSIANFPTLRSLEQIRNSIAYHKANVKIVAIGAGMAYGSAGITHHGTEDLAVMRAIPNMVIFSPADKFESRAVTLAAYKINSPCYIRLGKGREPTVHETPIENYKIGEALKIIDGEDIAIISTGAITYEAKKATEMLNNYSVALYSLPTIKPMNRDFIEDLAKKFQLIVTVEEGNILGGLGGAVAEIISETIDKRAVLKRIGLNDEFSSLVGAQEFLHKYYKIDAENICEVIRMTLDKIKIPEKKLLGGYNP